MNKLFLLLITVSAFFVAASPGQTSNAKPPSALDKTTLENYVRHLNAWDQSFAMKIDDPKPAPMDGFYEVTIHASKGQASGDFIFYVSKDGKHIFQGNFYETAENPFKPDLEKLKGIALFAPNYGTKGAPVVIVEFSDFECPYCREEAKILRSNLLNTYPKEVHLYHLDMPLDQVHPWARPAAIAGHCILKQNADAFWQYYDWIYEHQSEMTADNLKGKILEWAKDKNSIDSAKLTSCMDSKETEADVNQSIQDAKNLHVDQTPMFFVNGRRLAGAVPWPTLKDVIDEEISYQKTAKNAGEDCGCSVTLPLPGAPSATPTLGGLK